MMQVVPKWKVTLVFALSGKEIVLWVHDAFLMNVIRKIADLQFSESGLDQPTRMLIEVCASGLNGLQNTTVVDAGSQP